MKHLLFIFLCFVLFNQSLMAQCYCEDCPEPIINGAPSTVTLNVSGATNNTLGMGGQSLVNVGVQFTHDAAQELSLRLVAPDGSFVDLTIGEGLNGGQNNYFDLDFIPCSGSANPDCTNNSTWVSTDNWNAGPYTGSYYPEFGCLEDLTGDVNGQWTLEMEDVFVVFDGELFCFDLTFADDSGITCNNATCDQVLCLAQGGNQMSPSNVDAPEGDPSLVIDYTVSNLDCEFIPSGPEYIYIYLIYEAVFPFALVEIQQGTVDMTGYDQGQYVVQGISILATDLAVLEALDFSTAVFFDVVNLYQTGVICADNTTLASTVNIDNCIADFTGSLEFDAIDAEVGDPSLDPDWTITWIPSPPDPTIWGIYYVVYDQTTGVIVDYLTIDDFTGLIAGEYNVSILLYNLNDESQIPPANGTTTFSDLELEINLENICGFTFGFNQLSISEPCIIDAVGILEQEDITAPQNDPALDPDWDITFGGSPPDPAIYGFYFVVVNADTDELIAYYTTDDFTLLLDGNYYVTVVYYLLTDLPVLPPVNGTNTFNDLVALINNGDLCAQYFGYNLLFITPPCVADAGTFSENTISECEGSAELILDLTPNYSGGGPNDTDYGYTYVVSQNGIITDINPSQDFTGYVAGEYEICGLSFLLSDESNLPIPNGALTTADIIDDINNNIYCADLMTDCLVLTIIEAPMPIFTGPTEVCAGVAVQYTVENFTGNNSDYLFSITEGSFGMFVNDQMGTVEVIWNSGPGNICATEFDGGCEGQVCLTINVIPQPQVTIDGDIEVCPGEENIYVINPIPNGTEFYDISVTGGTIVTQTDNTVTVLWDDSVDGSISATLLGGNCNSNPSILNIDKIDDFEFPMQSIPVISCINTGIAILDIDDPLILDWEWTATNADIQIVNGFVNFTWQNIGLAEICLDITTACGTDQMCYDVDVLEAPEPFIEPELEFCSLTFLLDATPSFGNSWFWTSPGSVGTVTYTDQTNYTTEVTVAAPGTYTFVLQEFDTNCAGSVETTVTIVDGLSTDPPFILCDDDGNYIVTFDITSGTAPYSINGAEISGSTYSSSNITSGDFYSFMVEDDEGCTGLVEGSFICPCISDAGTMSATAIILCVSDGIGGQAIHNDDANLDSDDLGLYVLHTGDNAALGVVISINDTGEFFFDGSSMVAGQVYYISYVVGNEQSGSIDFLDPCLSVAVGQPIIFYDDPLVDAGEDDTSCDLIYNLSINAVTVDGNWSVIDQPNGSLADLQIISGETFVTVDMIGEYTFVLQLSENGCFGSDEVTITFLDKPTIENLSSECDGDLYTLSFDIIGGAAPYFINGVEVTNGSFTSEQISSGTGYGFIIIDSEGCLSDEITGTVLCNCDSSAGTMGQEPIEICAIPGTDIIGAYLGGATLEANDFGQFVLHTSASNVLGTILAVNNSPIFTYENAFGTNVTLYISHIVGDEDNGNVDLNDDCLSVSLGQPVVISELVKVDAGSYTDLCDFSFELAANDEGFAGAWVIIDTPVGAAVSFENISDASSTFETDLPGSYSLSWMPNNAQCVEADTTTFELDPKLVLVSSTVICDPDLQFYAVDIEVEGGASPYFLDGGEVGNVFTSPSIPSGQPYSFLILDSRGCELLVEGSADCSCTNAGGTMLQDTLKGCLTDTLIATYNEDALLDENDIGLFVLHSSPDNMLGAVFAISTDPIVTFVPGLIAGNVYYLSHIIGNPQGAGIDFEDPCLMMSVGQPVIFNEPPVVDAGVDEAICGLSINMNGTTSEMTATWRVIQTPFGAIVNIDENDLVGELTVTLPGEYILVLESDNGFCTSGDTVSIIFIESIFYEDLVVDCFADGYMVNFSVQGGSGSYLVDGDAIVGSNYTSELIATGEPYSFVITDSEGCPEVIVDGFDTCACENDAGTMSADVIELCIDDIIDLNELNNNDAILDDTDVRYHVIHTSSTDELGDVLGYLIYNSGVQELQFLDFSFEVGVTYYVSTVLANMGVLEGSGVDDPCVAVAVGTPIVWRNFKEITFNEDVEACVGDVVSISITASGDLPFEVLISDDLGYNDALLIDQENFAFDYVVSDEATLTIGFEIDELCFAIEKSELNITIDELPNAEVRESISICNDDEFGSIVSLDDLLISGFSDGRWIYDGADVQGSIDFSGIIAGEYKIEYLIESEFCASTQIYEVVVFVTECDCPIFDYTSENVSCFGKQNGSISILFSDELDIDELDLVLNEENIEFTTEIRDLSAGDYSLVILDLNDCVASFDITISEPAPVQISLGEDMEVEINDPIVIEAITNLLEQEIEGITWESLFGVLESNDLLLNTSFQSDDMVSISIIDENGCTGMDDIMVRVTFSDFVIPNVINANSISGNDVFRIYNTEAIDEIVRMSIYDRWGNLIFDVDNVDAASELAVWDGRSKGQAVNPGVYIYRLSLKVRGEERVMFGDLTVL